MNITNTSGNMPGFWDGQLEGGPCPLCREEFKHDDVICILSCPGGHHMCGGCHANLQEFDRQKQVADIGVPRAILNLSVFEEVRRNEGADLCPFCRGVSHCCTKVWVVVPPPTEEDEDGIVSVWTVYKEDMIGGRNNAIAVE